MTSVSPLVGTAAPAPISPKREAGPLGESTTTNTGFSAALSEAQQASQSAASDPAFRHQASRTGELKPEQAFESFVLRSFIEEMLPKENTAVFGSGTAGNIWRSMLAERIADEMAAGGGIGIAKTISRDAASKVR